MSARRQSIAEDREEIRGKVHEHLERYGAEYDNLANSIRGLLEEYRATDEGRRALYMMTSRRDYQFGRREVKGVQSTVDKILDEQASGKAPSFSIEDIDDMIGFKAVCVYPSDVTLVQRHFRQLHAEGRLSILKPFKSKRKRSGYRAVHGVVTLPGAHSHLRCEIQILTLLQEAWSCKTHDLTYKGENILRSDERDTALLARFLHAVDDQSEVIKDKIRQRMTQSERERAALVRTHLVNIFNGSAPTSTQADQDVDRATLCHFDGGIPVDEALERLRTLVRIDRESLLAEKSCRAAGIEVVQAADEFQRYYQVFDSQTDFSVVHGFSLVYSLGAFCGNRADNRGAACHNAARVVEHARAHSESDVPAALVHQGWTEFCAGNLETSITIMREALRVSLAAGDLAHVENALNDICYFSACLLDKDPRKTQGVMGPDERKARAKEGFESIKRAMESVEARLTGDARESRLATFKDSQGFLRIVSASRLVDVQEGIRGCESTLQHLRAFSPQMRILARMYVKNHVQRGWQRLVELSARRGSR